MNAIKTAEREVASLVSAMVPALVEHLIIPSTSKYGRAYSMQVRLKNSDFDATPYPSEKTTGVLTTGNPEMRIYRTTAPLRLPWTQQVNIAFELQLIENNYFKLWLKVLFVGGVVPVEDMDCIYSGSFPQLQNKILSPKFSKRCASIFIELATSIAASIEQKKDPFEDYQIKTELDIYDFDAVAAYCHTINRNEIEPIGRGFFKLYVFQSLILINFTERKVVPLSDQSGNVRICTLEDIPTDMIDQIRHSDFENRNWNMKAERLSIGKFGSKGVASLTWIISSEFHCERDEDGFGEEHHEEVAITCHINTSGKMIDTPQWKLR